MARFCFHSILFAYGGNEMLLRKMEEINHSEVTCGFPATEQNT
jgi:hypothetical protein